jgi:carboxypeptidase C (cathepsin A)
MGFENGPFLAQEDGTLEFSAFSWNRFATVVWIEQPAGVGFSYSSNSSDYTLYNDTVAALDNAAYLTAFFDAFPQCTLPENDARRKTRRGSHAQLPPQIHLDPTHTDKKLDLYLTSESYGGNYVPQWSSAVLSGGDRRLAAQLKGFSVNNPVFSLGENKTFPLIKNLVLGEIMYGHSLAPRWAYAQFVALGCETFTPTPECDDLRNALVSFGGDCFHGNACGDVRLRTRMHPKNQPRHG